MISGMPVTFMEIGITSSLTRWEDIPHLFEVLLCEYVVYVKSIEHFPGQSGVFGNDSVVPRHISASSTCCQTSNSARTRQPVQPPGWSTLSQLAYLDSVPNLFAIYHEAEYDL